MEYGELYIYLMCYVCVSVGDGHGQQLSGDWSCHVSSESQRRHRQLAVQVPSSRQQGFTFRSVFPFSALTVLAGWQEGHQSDAYDFLLTFRSNHGPISYRFRDKWRFQLKSQIFPTPVYLAPPLRGFPLELGDCAWAQENWDDGAIRPRKKFDDIFSRLDTIHKQIDRQTPADN